MGYFGDIRLGDTIDIKFTTVNSSGVPTTLAGTPAISAYPDNSLTQLTAGITLSVDFDSVTGLHNVRVVASSGNGYATATNYALIITTGTVDGSSVVGYEIGSFSIENRSAMMPTIAGRTLDISSGGEAGVDWANVGSPTTAVGLSGTTIKTATDIETDTADIQSRLPAALVSGRMDSNMQAAANGVITAAVIATDAIDADALAADAVTEIQSGLATGANQTTILSKLLKYVQLLARKDAAIATDNATELTAINANGGSGAGVYANTTDSQEALRDQGDAAWITATGFSTLDAAGVRSAVGLAAANLDTQLATIAAYVDTEVAAILAAVDTEVAAIKAKTDNLPASPAAVGSQMDLVDAPNATALLAIADALLSRGASNTEGAADVASLTELILAAFESSISGTTWTIRKTGGTTFNTRTVTTDAAAEPVTGVT